MQGTNGVTQTWYWAAVLFKAVHPGYPHRRRHLWERTVFLVQASDEAAARTRAERIARDKQHGYLSGSGDQVEWTFQAVEEVQSLMDGTLSEGTEVYWQFFERLDARARGSNAG